MDRRRYEDDYRSDPRRRETDRHGRDRVEARDKRVIDDRMDVREDVRGDVRGDVRRTRVDPRDQMDTGIDTRGDTRGDTRMDSRIPASRLDPIRANAAARVEPRPDRYGIEPRVREPEVYRDPRTGELVSRSADVYQDPPRTSYARVDDRMDRDRMDRDDIPTGRRTRDVVERDYDDDYRGKYNDYFVPGIGIDREVIQYEICRYLGNDATVRPFTKDGRQGYVVRAYRALTSAMIEDLKRDSARWRQDQERRQRQGRNTGSYAEMKGREVEGYADNMDVDMVDDYDHRPRRHDLEPRVPPVGRHGGIPVSSGYPSEPGYYVSSNQPGNYGPETLPRSHATDYRSPGGNTPPTTRAGQPGYGQTSYPGRTSATAPPVPVSSYRDPRTGQLMSGYEPTFPSDTGRPRGRHG